MKKRCLALLAGTLLLTGCLRSNPPAAEATPPLAQSTATVLPAGQQTVTGPAAEPVNPLQSARIQPAEIAPDAQTPIETDGWSRWPAKSALPWSMTLDLGLYHGRPADGQPLKGVTVILDPGHGGSDPGAVAMAADETPVYEKALNLEIAAHIRTRLESLGARVVTTRTADTWVSLYQRIAVGANAALEQWMSVAAAQQQTADRTPVDLQWIQPLLSELQKIYDINDDSMESGGRGPFMGMGANEQVRTLLDAERQTGNIIYLSVHCNSTADPNGTDRGTKVFYCDGDSIYAEEYAMIAENSEPDIHPIHPNYQYYDGSARRRLAQCVLDGVTEAVPALLNPDQPTVLTGNYSFIRECNLPAILLECGYMTDADELKLLCEPNQQQQIAAGAAEGIYRYFCDPSAGQPRSPSTGAAASETAIPDVDAAEGRNPTENTTENTTENAAEVTAEETTEEATAGP